MRRVFVTKKGSKTCKGITLHEDIVTVNDLRQVLQDAFAIEVNAILVARGGGGDGLVAEVIDLEFIRDNDHLVVTTPEDDVEREETIASSRSSTVRLNVGGVSFTTCRSSLSLRAPTCMLARMIAAEDQGMAPGEKDNTGAVMIDRSPEYFRPLLNYLRTGKLILDRAVNPEGVLEEAQYYGLEELIPPLTALVEQRRRLPDYTALTRREVVNVLLTTPCKRELRFQGVNLAGADLSKLDLRHINFKYANMKGCNLSGANLSHCNMERADLSQSVFDGAQMLGVKMVCANLEGASLRGCNFDDPAGSNVTMEGANLRGAVMEGSNMARVNLRVATIKFGNLKNCDLRAAVLAGADLEHCNLSGSDLGEANLRGANLKDTTLELMQTPLHMSQTIR